MSIEQIKATTAKALHVNEENVELDHRLMGGMSNFTYVIKVNEDKYTFRIPGKNAERFVDRDVEKDHIPLSEKLGLNNETVYLRRPKW
jgi:thiamine kinase-like enzyme